MLNPRLSVRPIMNSLPSGLRGDGIQILMISSEYVLVVGGWELRDERRPSLVILS